MTVCNICPQSNLADENLSVAIWRKRFRRGLRDPSSKRIRYVEISTDSASQTHEPQRYRRLSILSSLVQNSSASCQQTNVFAGCRTAYRSSRGWYCNRYWNHRASPTERKDLIGQNCNWCAPLHNTVNAVTRMIAAFTYFCVEEF